MLRGLKYKWPASLYSIYAKIKNARLLAIREKTHKHTEPYSWKRTRDTAGLYKDFIFGCD